MIIQITIEITEEELSCLGSYLERIVWLKTFGFASPTIADRIAARVLDAAMGAVHGKLVANTRPDVSGKLGGDEETPS